MYSLSTSWNAGRHDDGHAIVREIRDTGLDTLELSFALTKRIVDDIAEDVRAGIVRVTSLHNMCPLPDEIHPSNASPDLYSLSSPDDDERRRAVAVAKVTIDHAVSFGARAVVIHIGRVEIKDRIRELASHIQDPRSFTRLRDELLSERARLAGPYMSAVLRSMDELVPYALKSSIALGVENRYYYREIPLIDELDTVLSRFGKGELWYWHDVGHAAVAERLGFCLTDEFLARFGNRLLGIHLHDILNAIDDHQVPGRGHYDFTHVAPFIKADTIKVVEVHAPSTAADISEGVNFLKKLLGP